MAHGVYMPGFIMNACKYFAL